uniref:DRTGG domain-containing protein n=1 Tax=Mesoaciditoga lauensis TaxID=1495039 RepID=A0A7V3RFD1_9BACT
MLLSEITRIVEGKALWNFDDKDCDVCGATDMLSELLAVGRDGMLLISGMATSQLIKTADIVGVGGILIVRGKNIPEEMIELAKKYDIPLISTKLVMFTACGRLFCSGLSDINGTRFGY